MTRKKPMPTMPTTELETFLRLAAKYGTSVTLPPELLGKAPKKRGRPVRYEGEVDWTKEKRNCPQCKKTKLVRDLKDEKNEIGLRNARTDKRGVVQMPQSWCRACRASTDYHKK